MNPKEFAEQYYLRLTQKTERENAIREAIQNGKITPDMSLREMGEVLGISQPQAIKHYLDKFLKEQV